MISTLESVGFGFGNVPDKHVVGDVVQVSAVLEPGTSGGDVVRRAFSLNFDEHRHVGQVLAVPLVEGFQQLKAVRGRTDVDLDGSSVARRGHVRVLAGVETLSWKFVRKRVGQLELLAVGA